MDYVIIIINFLINKLRLHILFGDTSNQFQKILIIINSNKYDNNSLFLVLKLVFKLSLEAAISVDYIISDKFPPLLR